MFNRMKDQDHPNQIFTGERILLLQIQKGKETFHPIEKCIFVEMKPFCRPVYASFLLIIGLGSYKQDLSLLGFLILKQLLIQNPGIPLPAVKK